MPLVLELKALFGSQIPAADQKADTTNIDLIHRGHAAHDQFWLLQRSRNLNLYDGILQVF